MPKDYLAIAVGYAEDVRSGKIPACKDGILAAVRFLKELKKYRTRGKWFMDPEKARRACSFIELLPLSKGEGAAKGKRLILEPWQCYVAVQIFGWVSRKTRLRRVREVYLKVPRKNGKSEFAAGIALYMLCADGEESAEIYCGGKTEEQGRKVFEAACKMVWREPRLTKSKGVDVHGSKRMPVTVVQEETYSKMAPIVFDKGDGDSPSMYVCDEYHEHIDDRQYDTMTSGMGARSQPLTLVITTAGTNIAGACYNYEMDALKELNGARPMRDEFLVFVWGIDPKDDWKDPSSYIKANPNLGVSVAVEALEAQRRAAVSRPTKSATYRTKQLNQWANAAEAYFDIPQWLELADDTIDWDDFRGLNAFGGLDMARKRDFCAFSLFARDPSRGKWITKSVLWLPSGTVENREEFIQKWAEADTPPMTQTIGNAIDYDVIVEDVTSIFQNTEFIGLGFDPRDTGMLVQELAKAGIYAQEFTQNATNFNEPMKRFDKHIADSTIAHPNNPVMNWMMSNVIRRKSTRTDLDYPDKMSGDRNIDGPMSVMMALALEAYQGGSVDLSLTRMNDG